MTDRLIALVALYGCGVAPVSHPTPSVTAATFDASGDLQPPTDYRHWTFLTSGLGMTYGPLAAPPGAPPSFDSVFVDPRSYDQFVATGAWRDGAIFVVEVRSSEHTGSIVHGGNFQTDLTGIEVAVKDASRFANRWGYFSFPAALDKSQRVHPATAACYGCHGKNAAVENTFTQFYPTLFAVAKAKHTVRADFVGIPPSASDLYDAVAARGWSNGKSLVDETQAKWPDANLATERTLNAVAYRLSAAGKTLDALALFDEISRRFPASANAWDSLGETLEAAHQLDAARTATERGLAVVAADPSPQRDAIAQSLRARKARLAN
jgi:hypothetical protein